MRKYIGLVLSLIGISILIFHIAYAAKNETSETMFLLPLGILLGVGGAVFHIMINRKK